MRRSMVAANWKMHGRKAQVAELLDELTGKLDGQADYDIVICPPTPYLAQARDRLSGTSLLLGAQNAWYEDEGAFTGEVSAPMLAEFDCRYVIVGHSERRAYFAESDALVADKFAAVQRHGMRPILCVGETLRQREDGATGQVVLGQLDTVLDQVGPAAFGEAVVAYEPVWAIGTGRSATPDQAREVHRLIRDRVGELDGDIAARLRILYGGSVKGASAAELFAQPDIDGALVGGASLQGEEFATICSTMARRPADGTTD